MYLYSILYCGIVLLYDNNRDELLMELVIELAEANMFQTRKRIRVQFLEVPKVYRFSVGIVRMLEPETCVS